MSATNGLMVSFRSGGRLIGCCTALALLASALFASAFAPTASASKTPTAYVAIGDSLAFGYKEATFYDESTYPTFVAPEMGGKFFNLEAGEPVSAFEPGYVGDFATKLTKKEKMLGHTLTTYNLGCPGETSDGVIGHNPLLGGGAGAEYNPCGYHNVDGFPLKTEYASLGGAESQLEAAAYAVATKDVTAVTINIGSNDELASVAKCENPAYLAEQGFKNGLVECLETEVGPGSHEYPGLGVFGHILTNIGTDIYVLRHSGYATGPVVVLGFYNPQAKVLPGSNSLQEALNENLEAEVAGDAYGPEVAVANPFPYFNNNGKKDSVEAEKEHLEKYTEEYNTYDEALNNWKAKLESKPETNEGDIHATAAGYAKMAKLVEKALKKA
jgi:lysophospholipase L1-like esterase